jgi:cytochrome b561
MDRASERSAAVAAEAASRGLEDAQVIFRNTAERYGWVAIGLHWLMAALIAGQFGLGFVMTRTESQRLAFERIQLHKSIGLSLLALAAIRILWRLAGRQPRLPGTGTLESRAARAVHALLYAALFLLPLTGWALVSASVLEVPTMPFNLFVVPHLPLEISEASEDFWTALHRWIGWAAIGFVFLHVLAALRHHFWLRDDILIRMLGTSRRE